MTQTNEAGASPEEQPYLVVAALADGERVDPTALALALANPAVRDYLVDLIALRHATETMGDAPPAGSRDRHLLRIGARWLTAAAAVIISLAAGYFAGQRTAGITPSAQTVETAVDLGSMPVAPKPTLVVPLRPGVNWTETAGGH